MRPFILFSAILFSLPCFAKENSWGAGIIINNPTGFSAKYRFSQKNSFDAALGYSFGKSDNLSIHGTYLWENNRGIALDNTYLGYYLGFGGAFYSRDADKAPPPWAEDDPSDDLGLALRGSAGLNYYFNNPAIEVFAEIALNFFFVPSTDIDLGIAIGGRYFF